MEDLKVDVTVDNHGWSVEDRVNWIESQPVYEGHHIVVKPELSDETGLIGGYHAFHGDCCPGVKDAYVYPPTVHIFALLSTDMPTILKAIKASHVDWPRKARVLEKLERYVP